MLHVTGNLWDYAAKDYAVVIPINVGWMRASLRNVMGRGVARQAADRFPQLPEMVGSLCFQFRDTMPVIAQHIFDEHGQMFMVILFPTKPLAADPARSWEYPASLDLIRRSARQLAELAETVPHIRGLGIALPLVGCGAGGLARTDVLSVLDATLSAEYFTLVELPGAATAPSDDVNELVIL